MTSSTSSSLRSTTEHSRPRSIWRPMTAAASTTGTTFALARSRANNGSYSASGTPVSVRPATTCSM